MALAQLQLLVKVQQEKEDKMQAQYIAAQQNYQSMQQKYQGLADYRIEYVQQTQSRGHAQGHALGAVAEIHEGVPPISHRGGQTHGLHASAGRGQKRGVQRFGVLGHKTHHPTDPPQRHHRRTHAHTGQKRRRRQRRAGFENP